MAPDDVHYGRATEITELRVVTLDAAFKANPNRFKNLAPRPPAVPTAAWINRPKEYTPPINTSPCSLNS